MNKVLIISSHFNEDISWLIEQKEYDYKIYTKNKKNLNLDNGKVFECINKGMEASSYVSYIIDNYYNLPDYVVFIHGHEKSYHQTDDTLKLIKKAFLENININYISINRKDWRNIFNDNVEEEIFIKNWNLVKENFKNLNLCIKMPSKLEFTPCAQFIVSKENILLNSLKDYKNILKWLETTHLDSSLSGRVMEHIWHYILTHNEIEI